MNYIVWRQLLKVLVLSINRKLLRASRSFAEVCITVYQVSFFEFGFYSKVHFYSFVQVKLNDLFRSLFNGGIFSRSLKLLENFNFRRVSDIKFSLLHYVACSGRNIVRN